MPIVISQGLVITAPDDAYPVTLDHPIIGWHNVVTTTNIVADTTEAGYPASNLANPATHSQAEWRAADTTEQYITVTTGYVDEIDYVAVARHNFSSGEIPVSVGYFDTGSPPVWVELVEEVILTDDGPVIFRFTPQSVATVKVRLGSGSDAARAAVIYVGKLLILERKIYVGHTPMPHARKSSVTNGRSESGNFLGRIVLGEWRESTVPLSLISPAWYRAYMDAFLSVAKEAPFFFGWRPQTYVREVGYGWLIDDPMPTPTGPSNLIAFDLKVGGVV